MNLDFAGKGFMRPSARNSAAPYLVALAVSTPLYTIANYLWADHPFLKAQPVSLVLEFTCFAAALILWIPYRPPKSASPLLTAFMIGNLAAWAAIAWLVRADGGGFNFGTWLAVPLLLMILIKPPTFRSALSGTDAFALSLVAITVASHVLHVTHAFEFPHAFESRLPEFLRGIGLENRWEGPFASTSDAGPVGAFLAFYSLMRHGWLRWILLAGGLFILLASWSWTSIFAALAGLIVLTWFTPRIGAVTMTNARRLVATILFVAGGLVFVVVKDPTFNGRIPIWGDYISAWLKYPWTGMGTSGILSHPNMFSHEHAHNYYIDILTRHGVLGFIVTVPVIALAGAMAFAAGIRGLKVIPALFTVWALCLVGETLIDWRYIGYALMQLLLIGIMCSVYLSEFEVTKALASTDTRPAQGRRGA